MIRKADFVTVTGTRMRRQIIDFGIEEDRIAILPHAIDVDNYSVNTPDEATYSCIFIGRLIDIKRVDLILKAFSQVLDSHTAARLCIMGEGPLSQSLQELARDLGIENSVDFVGYQTNIQPFVTNSKIMVMASDREGLPFAIIEGMCSGLVPVTTPAGTIEDLITDGGNGLLFAQGDVDSMADSICRLLDDPALYNRLRANALQLRDDYGFAAATAVWDSWLNSLDTDSAVLGD